MAQETRINSLLKAAVAVSVLALFLAVAFPHVHGAASTHRSESCRACKIQESFSAAPPAAAALLVPSAFSLVATLDPVEAPSLDRVSSLHAPRSPPAIS